MTDEGTLMKTVQKINPGQPEMPEWIYNGAILGVQGGNFCKNILQLFRQLFVLNILGTDRMLDILHQAQENDVAVSGLWIQDWSGKITTEFGTRFYKIVSTKTRLLK